MKCMRKLWWLGLAASVWTTGCATHTGTGTAAGGLLGAATGALMGGQHGHAGRGAVLGGALGAIGGGLIGAGQDEVERRNRVAAEAAQNAIGVTDVVQLTRSGVGDDAIVAKIRAAGPVAQPSTQDMVYLREQGVSNRVIQTMIDASRRPPRAVIYEPAPVYVVEPPPRVHFGIGYHWGCP